MKSRIVLFATAVIALLILAWFLHPAPPADHVSPPPVAEAARLSSVSAPAPAAAATSLRASDQPSHLADNLNSAGGDIHADLRLLNDIFNQYRSAIHGSNPVGDNLDITAVLTGRNPLGFAFIPKDHPAIDAAGELCDRWGSPFFFHQLSGTQMEIRSAGPDKKLWTADDEVLTPGLYVPQR